MIADRQEYEVELVVTTRHTYTTFSRTPEEAEADAEAMLEDGDLGVVSSSEVEQAEAFPVGDAEEMEDDD